jgi:hypothetical protein
MSRGYTVPETGAANFQIDYPGGLPLGRVEIGEVTILFAFSPHAFITYESFELPRQIAWLLSVLLTLKIEYKAMILKLLVEFICIALGQFLVLSSPVPRDPLLCPAKPSIIRINKLTYSVEFVLTK